MSQHIARWTYLSQVIVQRATLVSILSLAVAGAIWSLAAAVGFAPGSGSMLAWVASRSTPGLPFSSPSRCSFSASASSSR